MSAAGASEDAPARVARAVSGAGFVRLVATADGDALAAAGLLARALAAREVPFQASVAAVPDAPATDADCTVAVGHAAGTVTLRETPLAVAAADAARDLAPDAVDPTLALAGAVAAGDEPAGELLEEAALERRPGVALPTDDAAEGLACSTLFHARFSGDADAAAAALESVDADDGRELASLVALSAVRDAPPRAATAVERALRPYDCDRFETLGGYAEVLDAVARERPGTGIALALGNDVASAALSAWREHGRAAHAALRTTDTSRYDGVYVARPGDLARPIGGGAESRADEDGRAPGETDEGAASSDASGPRAGAERSPDSTLGTVARLCLAFRSPEPVALAVVDGEAAAATAAEEDDAPTASAVEDAFRGAATALDGRSVARDGRGTAVFDGAAGEFVDAFREEL